MTRGGEVAQNQPIFDGMRAFWLRSIEKERALGECWANNPAQVSPSDSPRAPEEGDGDQPLPGLPSGLLAYQLNFKEHKVDGGGRGGLERAQGRQAPILPPRSDT